MTNLDTIREEYLTNFKEAFKNGDAEKAAAAFTQYNDALIESIKAAAASSNSEILARRGVRQLTTDETRYYENLIKAVKAPDPRQAIANFDVAMPFTIIDSTLVDLAQEHPLLNEIDFQNVEYLTRWILDDSTKTNAVWGPINAAIVTEITGQFKEIDVNQKKLTAFFLLSEDLVNLGPAFIDTYVRTILMEAIYGGLEAAIISGNGKDCPIGLMMDLSKESSGIYAQKTPIIMKDIAKEYTGNVAKLAKNEKGKNKNFDSVILVMNLTTKLNKFLPAASFRVPGTGEYVTTMPFPTKVVVSNEIEDDNAVMFVPKRYFMGVGMGKEGKIEYSDENKFLEDQRVFKVRLYGNGRPYDNTDAIVLDLSKLQPYAMPVISTAAASTNG